MEAKCYYPHLENGCPNKWSGDIHIWSLIAQLKWVLLIEKSQEQSKRCGEYFKNWLTATQNVEYQFLISGSTVNFLECHRPEMNVSIISDTVALSVSLTTDQFLNCQFRVVVLDSNFMRAPKSPMNVRIHLFDLGMQFWHLLITRAILFPAPAMSGYIISMPFHV